MLTNIVRRAPFGLALLVALLGSLTSRGSAQAPENLFDNPSFERGRDGGWHFSKAGKTEARFTVDGEGAAAGALSARVTLGTVVDWGAQFGQGMDAGEKGKTYTFAVLAKSTKGPVIVDLQIERRAKPWDRAARGRRVTLRADEWTELHVTFRVERDFPQGWFAYISCTQPNCEFRADLFRLYEGEYVPYEEIAQEEAAVLGVRVFDTCSASPELLSGETLAGRNEWAQLPEGLTGQSLEGDAVVMNNRLALVLRQRGPGAEVYGKSAAGLKRRAVLSPAGARGSAVLSSVRIVENESHSATVEADFRAADGRALGLRYTLRMGQVFVETEPRLGTKQLRVEAPCRFAVMPDFFADDMVLDARAIPMSRADIPSENFLLHLLGREEAVLMSVWKANAEDVEITLSGQGAARTVEASEIHYGQDGKVWVAVMEERGIWHTRDVAKGQAGRVVALDWSQPFPAQWRVDWRRHDKLTGSWEMVAQRPDGRFTKHGWFGSPGTLPADRKRWTTVLGRFPYPCWIDRSGRGHLQPLAKKVISFQGPIVLYAINRVRATPLDRYTVVDIVRNTLGVGPCEYILDVEGQKTTYQGIATCGARDRLNGIYSKKQQKQRKAQIEKTLVDVLTFVKFIRGKIEGYTAFGHEMLKYLDEQKTAHPELADFLKEMEDRTREMDAAYARRREKIKTPAYVAELCNRFRATLIDYDGADALAKCKAITQAIVVVGGSQDELVGECRMAVKRLRQGAALAMARDPRVAEIATEIRRRTRPMLRNPAGHEGARH